MEPVFMVLGQSAATAAAHAIEAGVGVQNIDRAKFKARLLADKQVLDFAPPPVAERKPGIEKKDLPGVIVDDGEAERTGFEKESTAASPYVGHGYRHDGNAARGTQRALFKATLPAAGAYEVRVSYTALPNRATNVPVTVRHSGGNAKTTVNQRKAPPIDGLFLSLGTWQFGGEAVVEFTNTGTDGHVIIDAVQWLPVKK
jgi:hypothetical protein